MKKKWIERFEFLLKIINEIDPMGLIRGGAPEDEYEVEVLEIFLAEKKSPLKGSGAREKIEKIFSTSFGAGSIEDEVAEEILKSIQTEHDTI